jgi:hypothetical protein
MNEIYTTKKFHVICYIYTVYQLFVIGVRFTHPSALTFRNHASYMQDEHTTFLQTPHFIYFFNKYMYWIFLNVAHPPFFSLQNAVYFKMLPFLVPVLFTIQSVLKFKCQIPVPKGYAIKIEVKFKAVFLLN